MMKSIAKISKLLADWVNSHGYGAYSFFIIAVGLGLFCGASAALLKGGITFVTHLLFDTLNIHKGNWIFFLLPVGAILLATLYSHFVVRQPMDHATERIADDLAHNQGNLSPRVILGSLVSCSITLGMGGSAGAESPIAYTGAAIGSNMGRIFKLSAEDILSLLGCGAAAGIAGIYMAPIGGVMYALEVLKMRQSLTTILAATLASLTSALTCYVLLGCHTDVQFVPEMRFDTHLIPWVVVLGIICGAYSVYYSAVIKHISVYLKKFKNIWLRAALGGLALSGLLYLFPSLYGEGYATIGHLMDNEATSIISYGPFFALGSERFAALMGLFVLLLIVKPIATGGTNESGGVGGDFTPTLFCGAVAGYLFATALNHYFHMDLPYALFAFFGMAAVMSGAKEAPLMAIFITAEMTGLYGFILPLTITALASMVTTVMLQNDKFISRYFKMPNQANTSTAPVETTTDTVKPSDTTTSTPDKH